jgi:hypothetical protein
MPASKAIASSVVPSKPLCVDRDQEVGAALDRLGAELAGRDLQVLLLDRAHDIASGEAARGDQRNEFSAIRSTFRISRRRRLENRSGHHLESAKNH